MNIHDQHRLSQEFREIEALCDAGPVNLRQILQHVKGRGEALFTLFLAGPFMLPIPLPGLSIPFGILVSIFGFSLATGRQPWLPEAWVSRNLPELMIRRFCQTMIRIFQKSERYTKPRWEWVHRRPFFKFAAGLMIVFCGFLLALPLPPGTNAPPAVAIVFLSVAMLERDGLLMVIGYTIFVLNILFFSLLSLFGYEAVLALLRSLI
ncbi:MAG: exopolysaccharide biosynthesis protein [Proteobacteria bacterium]|nr:exopolysaccharide biosynthesis protein [Pseudomonadota bacterium]